MLSETVKCHMLSEARRTVELAACGKTNREAIDLSAYAELQEHKGTFVTLKHRGGELRGCIGTIIGREPLYRAVLRLAEESAMHDPRFPPVACQELQDLYFEISVLTHPKPVKNYQKIQLGKDGIILICSSRSSVFLPQVPVEQGWDIETTLRHLAVKAGLPHDQWRKDDCLLQVFQAEVFGEE